MRQLSAKAANYALVGGVIGGVLTVLAVGLSLGWENGCFLALIGIGGAFFAGFIGYNIAGTSDLTLGWYNGRNYIFKNKEFQRQFEELNPDWKNLSELI